MAGQLVRTGVAGFERTDEGAVLASLLALTTDAVLVFNERGIVLLANEEAERLFRSPSHSLVDSDVRLLFPPVAASDDPSGSLSSSLPFPLDGSLASLMCRGADATSVCVRLRCERIATSASEAYLLAAHEVSDAGDARDENERLVEELSRANKRLAGTLGIVLGTLDSLDIGTLFSRILEEITSTVEAQASAVYMAEQDGYRLRGTTDFPSDSRVPAFLPYDFAIADAVAREGRTLRVRVRPLTRDELRLGDVGEREVVVEGTGATMRVSAQLLPPFAGFAAVPVWFGGHTIALIVVGWQRAHSVRTDDARLLDAVAEYLSVQLAGAFAALRTQHAEHLEALGSSLRERLLSQAELSADFIARVFGEAARELGAACVRLAGNPHQRATMGVFTSEETAVGAKADAQSVPMDLSGLCRQRQMPQVTSVAEMAGLSEWLRERSEPSQGLLVALGSVAEAEADLGFLLLRHHEEEPFQEVDVAFVGRLAADVLEVAAGERARSRDKRIAQALQQGMRNELQQVKGLSAQSRYSSATEAASVGGDFYDLVRLPQRRACVIMGDVSGKGVEAASVSSGVRTALGAYAWEGLSPARMVRLLNDYLLGFSRVETFATLFVGVFDLGAGRLVYCSAGHPPALMVKARSGELQMLGVQSGVVGAFEGLQYRDGEVAVEEGDVLLLYTDGVTEARNAQGAFFGEDGLRDVVSQEAARGFDGLCDRILDGVSAFSGNSLEDDVALVVVRVDEVGE